MIDPSASIFYFCYGLVCVALGVAYVRLKSSEGSIITTKEFQSFQTSFVTGYACILFCEFIAAASFYHTLISIHLELEQITRLYLVTIIATTLTSVVLEIVDVGTRRDKCIVSALLYSVSMFSIFFGGHYEMLLMGRIVYGAASALQQSSFENYAVHEHSTHGFPDDWLSHTFTFLTHVMALMAGLSGVAGQVAAGMGPMGCVALCCIMFAFVAVYLAVMWEKDVNTPRFMLSGFLFNLNQTSTVLRSNRHLLMLMVISSTFEASITIFTFYWAPWLTSLVSEEDIKLPYEIVFASFIGASMLGNYIFQMISQSQQQSSSGTSNSINTGIGIENMLQMLLVATSVAYFCGAVFQTPSLAYCICIIVQLCVGVYWPCIGYYRGRVIPHNLRNIVLVLQKAGTLVLTLCLLGSIHHSPLLLLSACSLLTGAAAYLQNAYLDGRVISQLVLADDFDDDDNSDADSV